ncbi:hypothetical protein NDU88_003569 [Pleurodeles waltl]|uniref:Uncharacterized protein n=1 Tax=Pleurodeles waltl TaxID=8319 RepID=A0AAV7TNY8_PLEWA|nr:hypothetical protein NDU88_003569 [Pleurodeles waltl]
MGPALAAGPPILHSLPLARQAVTELGMGAKQFLCAPILFRHIRAGRSPYSRPAPQAQLPRLHKAAILSNGSATATRPSVRSELSPRAPGRSKGQVTELRRRTADERRRVRSKDTEDTEDESRRSPRTQEPRRLLVPSAPLECGTGVKNGTAVPTREKESQLREAEL